MNFLEQVGRFFESEQDQLRRLFADGQPLPSKPVPPWVRSQPTTEMGMVRLPHLERVDGLGWTFDTPFWSVFWILIGGFMLWLGYTFAGAYPAASWMYLPGTACLIGALFAWTDQLERLEMQPEAAKIVYSPGDTLLVMLPRHRQSSSPPTARLIYRRRWLVIAGKVIYWKTENLSEIPVHFERAGPDLLHASISLPDDAAASYHASEYRHDWLLAIDHANVWGYPRTDLFLLWIAP